MQNQNTLTHAPAHATKRSKRAHHDAVAEEVVAAVAAEAVEEKQPLEQTQPLEQKEQRSQARRRRRGPRQARGGPQS